MKNIRRISNYTICVAVTIILAVFFSASFIINAGMYVKLPMGHPKVLDVQWMDAKTGQKLPTQEPVLIKSGKSRTVQCRVTDPSVFRGSYVGFWTGYMDYAIWLDKDSILKSDPSNYRFGHESSEHWAVFQINQVPTGRMLTIHLTNRMHTNQLFYLNYMAAGSAADIREFILLLNAQKLVFAIILDLLGILLLIYTGMMKLYRVKSWSKKPPFYLGLLCFAASLWVFIDSPFPQYISGNLTMRYQIFFGAMAIIPMLFLVLFRDVVKEGRFVLNLLLIAYNAWVLISMVAYVGGGIPLEVCMYGTFVMLGIIATVMTYFLLLNYRHNGERHAIVMIPAFLFMAGGAGVDVGRFFILGNTMDSTVGFRHGFTVAVLILIVVLSREAVASLREAQAARTYKDRVYIDSVTKGNTRLYLDDRIHSLPPNRRYFVIATLDAYSQLILSLGKVRGSRLLQDIYRHMEQTLNANEYMCYMGDADFGFYVLADSMEDMHKKCFRLKTQVEMALAENEVISAPKIRFGVYSNEQKSKSMEDMVVCTLAAMQDNSPSRYQDISFHAYDEETRKRLALEQYLVEHVDQAIENKNITFYLQPKVSLTDGKIHGAEALARWISKETGFIKPDQFIPVFEQNGMIRKIDLCIFRQVCEKIAEWMKEDDVDVPVISVNISKAAINYTGFFNPYRKIMKETGVPGKYLEFELTENIAYENMELLKQLIDDIHRTGAKCSMDDFGKSYSNLSAFGTLSFDVAKMDICFFNRGFPEDDEQNLLVTGTLKLLQQLGLTVVAEGIENKEQAERLYALHCDMVQGYYYGKPMTPVEFRKLQRDNQIKEE